MPANQDIFFDRLRSITPPFGLVCKLCDVRWKKAKRAFSSPVSGYRNNAEVAGLKGDRSHLRIVVL